VLITGDGRQPHFWGKHVCIFSSWIISLNQTIFKLCMQYFTFIFKRLCGTGLRGETKGARNFHRGLHSLIPRCTFFLSYWIKAFKLLKTYHLFISLLLSCLYLLSLCNYPVNTLSGKTLAASFFRNNRSNIPELCG
jgi:hypothetical protein